MPAIVCQCWFYLVELGYRHRIPIFASATPELFCLKQTKTQFKSLKEARPLVIHLSPFFGSVHWPFWLSTLMYFRQLVNFRRLLQLLDFTGSTISWNCCCSCHQAEMAQTQTWSRRLLSHKTVSPRHRCSDMAARQTFIFHR